MFTVDTRRVLSTHNALGLSLRISKYKNKEELNWSLTGLSLGKLFHVFKLSFVHLKKREHNFL